MGTDVDDVCLATGLSSPGSGYYFWIHIKMIPSILYYTPPFLLNSMQRVQRVIL